MNLAQAILRVASLLAPAGQRRKWLEEWQSELWYVGSNELRFCLGAFADAWWVRRNAVPSPCRPLLESPYRCLSLLACAAVASVWIASYTPMAPAMLSPVPYPNPGALVLLGPGESEASPHLSYREYRTVSGSNELRVQDMAFYRIERTPLGDIAIGTENLFETLEFAFPPQTQATPRLVLSEKIWKERFDSDPRILGRSVSIAGRTAVVSRVLPEDQWQLPGHADAWLLEAAPPPAEAIGVVVARMRAPAFDWGGPVALRTMEGKNRLFTASPVQRGQLRLPFLLTVLFALMLTRVFRPWARGGYPANRGLPQRWLFFLVKSGLVLTTVCCASMVLATLVHPALVVHFFIAGNVLAVGWAIADQRRRCPTCLRQLGHPTRIGGASNVFLDWYGTELMCAYGHGLLYIPEIRTSSYANPQWRYLDRSWASLFS